MIWWFSVAMIAPLWGVLSTRWAFQALLSLCSAALGLIGLVLGRTSRASTARRLVSGLIGAALLSFSVVFGFWLLIDDLGLGQTRWERISFAIFAVLGSLLSIQPFPAQLAASWRASMAPAPDDDEGLGLPTGDYPKA